MNNVYSSVFCIFNWCVWPKSSACLFLETPFFKSYFSLKPSENLIISSAVTGSSIVHLILLITVKLFGNSLSHLCLSITHPPFNCDFSVSVSSFENLNIFLMCSSFGRSVVCSSLLYLLNFKRWS